MRFKVIYHLGDSIDLRTKVASGHLVINDERFVIDGTPPVSVSTADLRAVELFRQHGVGRMLKIKHAGGILFVSVVRCNLFGYFAIINFFGTGRLYNLLSTRIVRES
jgi:hypothetical protein